MSEIKYAGFWRRFAALTIDQMVLSVPFWVYYLGGLSERGLFKWGFFWVFEQILHGWPLIVYTSWISMVWGWAYFSGMESSPLQATIGKLAVGLYVTDLQGQRISFGRATARFFGKILSVGILSIGFIMAGFTAKKQALHDMLSDCLVLSK